MWISPGIKEPKPVRQARRPSRGRLEVIILLTQKHIWQSSITGSTIGKMTASLIWPYRGFARSRECHTGSLPRRLLRNRSRLRWLRLYHLPGPLWPSFYFLALCRRCADQPIQQRIELLLINLHIWDDRWYLNSICTTCMAVTSVDLCT